MSDFKELVKNLYTSKDRELTPEKFDYIQKTYAGGKEQEFVKNFYETIGEDLTQDKLTYITDTYLKKKEPLSSESLVTKYPSPLQETAKLVTGEIFGDISKGIAAQEQLKPKPKAKKAEAPHYGQFIDIGQPIAQEVDKSKAVIPESGPMPWEMKQITKGQIQGKIANILSAGKRPTIDELGEIATLNKELQSMPRSEAEIAFEKDGFGIFKKNPLLGVQFLGETMLSSLSSLAESGKRTVPTAVGMGAAMGAPIAGIGAVAGAATGLTAGLLTGGYNISTSQDILNSLSDNGVDISDKDSLINAFSDEKRMAKIRSTAAKYGVPILAFDALTSGIAGKLIGGAVGKSLSKKIIAGMGEAGIQAVGGSGGELAGQLASGKKVNLDEVALEGIASLATDVPDITVGAMIERRNASSNNKTLATQIAVQGNEAGLEDAKINLDRDLKNGVISEEEHQDGVKFIEKAAEINTKIPETVQGENRAKSIELINERDKLTEEINQKEEQKKSVDVAYHKSIDESNKEVQKRIDEINNQLGKLAKPENNVEEVIVEEEIPKEEKVIYVQKFYPDKPNENLTERQIGSIEKAISMGIEQGKSGDEIYGILNALGFAPANVGGKAMEINLKEYLNNRVSGKDNRTFQETQSNQKKEEIQQPIEEDKTKKLNLLGKEIGLDKPTRSEFEEGEEGDNKYAEANIKHNKKVDDLILGITEEGTLYNVDGDSYDVEFTSQGVRVSPTSQNDIRIYAKGKRLSPFTPFTKGFTFKPKKKQISNQVVEEIPDENIQPPTEEQILDDLKNKRFVTFEYKSELEVPDVFKNKITSIGEINGGKSVKVTLTKSEADYELNKNKTQEYAVQVESPTSVLQPTQERIGETGSERGGMEQGKQGEEVTPKSISEAEVKVNEEKVKTQNIAELPDEISIGEMIDKTGVYKGEKGSFYQDGKTVVFKVEGKNKEYELGNIEELKNTPISDFDISHEESVVKISDKGGITVRNVEYKNLYSDPLQAINKDKEGNVLSVNLETSDGKKRTFRGNIAEDIAYQITLKEINKNDETRTTFEQYLNEDPAASKEMDNGTILETPETEPIKNNEQISREKISAKLKEQPKPIKQAKNEPSKKGKGEVAEPAKAEAKEPKTEVKDGAKEPPTTPPTQPKEPEKGVSDLGKKMRAFYKNIIERAKGLSEEDRNLLKDNPNALYDVLPHSESRKIAEELIEELGVDEAVLEATKKTSNLQPVERVMILGAAMDYYAKVSKEKLKSGDEAAMQKAAENEIDAQEKMQNIAKELGTLGTDFGRAISIFNEVYKLSNLALEIKLKLKVDQVNKSKQELANQQSKEIKKIVTEDKDVAIEAANDLTEAELMRNADAIRKISDLEKEVADLKKQILERDKAQVGTKKNPLKIKRITNDTEYDKRVKEFQQRQRSIISKDDISDLTYFGLYHIENGITKFADWYEVMNKKFKGFKDKLSSIYTSARDKAIENGADKNIFDTDEDIQKRLEEFQKESDAKRMALATKKLASAKLKQAMENNPDRAKIEAPKIAAERIRKDAERNLDMLSTKTEQTYLKKLVQTINTKAKEYYKETKQNVKNINDILAFAIANSKSDYKIWERTKEEVERQIDQDTSLTDEQKSDVKEFLEDYTESIFDTLLTTNQIDQLIREKLIENGYGTEKMIKGKLVKAVDWNKVTRNEKNRQEAKSKIIKAINDLGFNDKNAKAEIDAILTQFDNKILDKKTAGINALLNKGVLNKVKSALGVKKVSKSQVGKLIEMNNKGILDDVRVKDVLADELGLVSLSKDDLARVRELSSLIDNPNIPEFMRKQFQEQLQYLFDSKGGNLMYLENREFTNANRLSSLYNQIQNMTGLTRPISTLFTVGIKTGNFGKALKVYLNETFNSIQDAKTILIKGRVSRGTSFSDLTMTTEGEVRTRYLEYSKGKIFGGAGLGKSLYAKLGGKTVDVNLLNQAYSKTKFINRLLESVDTIGSGQTSGLTRFWQITKYINKFYPELSSKQKSQKIWDMLYSIDRAAERPNAIKSLEEAGIKNPSESEINRTINEKAERNINKLISQDFYRQVESLKPMAETALKNEGNENPTADEITSKVYKLLGTDEPLDVVARGERQAARETGKLTTVGITSLLITPLDLIQKGISQKLRKNTTTSGRLFANGSDAAISYLFPYVHSIGRWLEMQLELTPYGYIKSAVYKSGLAKAIEGADKAKFTKEEYSELGDDYAIRATLGLSYNIIGMYAISLANMLAGEEEDKDKEKVIGTAKKEKFPQERVQSVGKPKQSINIAGYNLPLQIFGNNGISMGMYADAMKYMKDPEYQERSILYISAMVLMENASSQWYESTKRYGGIASALIKGQEEKYAPALGKIFGSIAGSQIPYNRFQTEMATVLNPQSKSSIDFGVNVLNQMSIFKSFTPQKPNFDYRGRTYDYGDIFVNSADGVVKMFKKAKGADEADEFLSKINFAATDAYRETKDIDNYNFAIIENDGKKRSMTPDEYYVFKFNTAKLFNEYILKSYKYIDGKTILDNGIINKEETLKFKKQFASFLLTEAKKKGFAQMLKEMKIGASIDIIQKLEENKLNLEIDMLDKNIDTKIFLMENVFNDNQ